MQQPPESLRVTADRHGPEATAGTARLSVAIRFHGWIANLFLSGKPLSVTGGRSRVPNRDCYSCEVEMLREVNQQ
jgi:hypothetical protein